MYGAMEMSKAAVIKGAGERVSLTPELAGHLLEHNKINRPISDGHVQRIARQIIDGKWRFNGDTIKIAESGDVLDGQHRCWAVIEAKQPVDTIIVSGIERDAFATIDTLRKPRSGSDVIALNGQELHRNTIAGTLSWLIRWQRGVLERWREPTNKVENADIEAAFQAHNKGIVRAVERSMTIRRIANPSIMGFVYYIAANQNLELGEQLITALDSPGRLAQTHPFFQLRSYFLNQGPRGRKDPLVTIALTFKALNAAYSGTPVKQLNWKSQGKLTEDFPKLKISGKPKASA